MAYDHTLHTFRARRFDRDLHTYKPKYNRNPPSDRYLVKNKDKYIYWGNNNIIRASGLAGGYTILTDKILPTGKLKYITFLSKNAPLTIKIKLFEKTLTHFLFIEEKIINITNKRNLIYLDMNIKNNYYLATYSTLDNIYKDTVAPKIYYRNIDVTNDYLITDYNSTNQKPSISGQILHNTTYKYVGGT